MPLLRLVTIHPILVHLTLGLIPLVIVGYALARILDSERWTFVADVTLYAAAIAAFATAAFGLVSYVALDWPGGLSPWKGLHLGFGIATAVLLIGLAAYRIGNRKRQPRGGRVAIGASLVIGALAAFTGWLGGEVLVYRSGMAVRAAGDGALALPVGEPDAGEPPHVDGMLDAMHRLRESWAAIETEQARMIVEHPSDAGFDHIARHAHRVSQLASWVVRHATSERPGSHAPAHAQRHMAEMANDLAADAAALATAATGHDLATAAGAIGRISSTCAHCHTETRWREGEAP